MYKINKRYFFILIILFSLNSCTTPSEKFTQLAADLQYQQQTIQTPLFKHQLFTNLAATQKNKSTTVHVYLDGDGTPWKNKRWLATDPTSRNPLILRLMQLDTSPAILLGRPCYHGLSKTTKCDSKYWTSHRYSSQVVESMAIALNQWLEPRDYAHVVLIGYSGGGVLAILLANKIPRLNAIVTLASNLDVDEWSHYHGYLPLNQSLNPADSVTNTQIYQLHIAGTDDTVAPAYIIEQFANQQINADYLLLPDQNHRCCWTQVWPEILNIF